jgi:hypothetical protein
VFRSVGVEGRERCRIVKIKRGGWKEAIGTGWQLDRGGTGHQTRQDQNTLNNPTHFIHKINIGSSYYIHTQ